MGCPLPQAAVQLECWQAECALVAQGAGPAVHELVTRASGAPGDPSLFPGAGGGRGH